MSGAVKLATAWMEENVAGPSYEGNALQAFEHLQDGIKHLRGVVGETVILIDDEMGAPGAFNRLRQNWARLSSDLEAACLHLAPLAAKAEADHEKQEAKRKAKADRKKIVNGAARAE